MKHALARDGKLIEATDRAPRQAECPHCGGLVTLRGRTRMSDDEMTYFWRHHDNRSLACPTRKRGMQWTGEHDADFPSPRRRH